MYVGVEAVKKWHCESSDHRQNLFFFFNCEIQFIFHYHNTQGPWSKKEDKALMRLAKETDYTNWACIASQLGVSYREALKNPSTNHC